MSNVAPIIHDSNLLSSIASNDMLNAAFKHVYKKRKKDGHNSDIWETSLNWEKYRSDIRDQLLSGTYQLSPLMLFASKESGLLSRWSSINMIVLKALSWGLQDKTGQYVGKQCAHLKDHGGLKGAVRQLGNTIKQYKYVIKSDVAKYYESMDHDIVLNHCNDFIKDKRVLTLIQQYLNRVEVFQGEHCLIEKGIPRGCPLSPLMGAIMLKSLDGIAPKDIFYARYVDDWVILTKTKRQCRRLVKKMHHVMRRLQFKLALDKTFIGKTSKGFDFLGYCFNHTGLIGLAKKTIHKFIEGTNIRRDSSIFSNFSRFS